jgi:hypothetical protein
MVCVSLAKRPAVERLLDTRVLSGMEICGVRLGAGREVSYGVLLCGLLLATRKANLLELELERVRVR